MTLSSNPFLDLIQPKQDDSGSVFAWATVVSVSPLQIKIDAESTPLEAPPSTLVQVGLNDRVYIMIVKRRATIIGRAGGVYDSGVRSLTALSPWAATSDEGVHIARYGSMVHFSAIVTSSAATSGRTTILNIPAGFRPMASVYATSYGGLANLSVGTNGSFYCWSNVSSGATVRYSTSWYTSDAAPN